MKDPRWQQKNPQDQFNVIFMAMQGHFDNWKEKIIDEPKFLNYMNDLFKQLQNLEPFLRGEEEWNNPRDHRILKGKTLIPATSEEWNEWTHQPIGEYVFVAADIVGEWKVSTVFCGLSAESLWVTEIAPVKEPVCNVVRRKFNWNSYEEAQEGHPKIVKQLENNEIEMGKCSKG